MIKSTIFCDCTNERLSEDKNYKTKTLKTCDKSLLKPLVLLLHNSMTSFCYPDIQKRSNIIPVHKNCDKKLVKNYRPISLLPMFGKIFEKIIFNSLYNPLLNKRLLNLNEPDFRPADSRVNQSLAITHEIFELFDCNQSLELTSIFLDTWHSLLASRFLI